VFGRGCGGVVEGLNLANTSAISSMISKVCGALKVFGGVGGVVRPPPIRMREQFCFLIFLRV
jgi:hypothetical protein